MLKVGLDTAITGAIAQYAANAGLARPASCILAYVCQIILHAMADVNVSSGVPVKT